MINKKPAIYTVSTAHLDTSWLWELEDTIEKYIPDTIKSNFKLLEKYPEYKFNFEGSLRYELIKEYYPDDFKKIKYYVSKGRWHPCGSCYENGDVNIPSPEALIRNILYGNSFFKEEFGVCSNDIFLPDCFGFGKALPSVAAHCSITGFSTGKLFWGSSVPIPFDIGKWNGIDGNGLWSALMPFSYTTCFKNMTKAKRIQEKLDKIQKENLPPITFAYHGIGDRGGAPHKSSVKNVVKAIRNNDKNNNLVYSATTKEFFDKIESMPDEEKNNMPEFNGEFLLTAHGAGSYTSRTVTKRWNKRCELLADAAERFATAAFVNNRTEYPEYGLDKAWKNVIAHQFHDDITGTSFEECYKRNHNDYIQALNTFSSEFTASCKSLSECLDTSFVKGLPVIVANPLQTKTKRKQAVTVKLSTISDYFRVFDSNGNEVPSQCKSTTDCEKIVTFIAEVSSCSLTVFDLQESDKPTEIKTDIYAKQNIIENKNIKISVDTNGDICSVFDKVLNKELLKKPICYQLLNNTHSFDWPAWEIKYDDLCSEPYTHLSKPLISVEDNGPALCSLKIIRNTGKSTFTQIISLDCESKYVSVYNETDWREESSLLKAQFSFTAENEFASYDIGLGAVNRPTNTDKLCEVPAQKWADISNSDLSYGVSVFSDSRAGWDKPDKSTLRLTLIHTPMSPYRWECSQHIMDMGINRYSFAVMGHIGSAENSSIYADEFCQPMHTFLTEKHSGDLGKEYSFLNISDDNVRVLALKKANNSDSVVLRVAECSGYDKKDIEVSFASEIESVYSASGDETQLSKIDLKNKKLIFNIGHNGIKTFLINFKKHEKINKPYSHIALPYNERGITKNADKNSSTLNKGISVPYEIIPEEFDYCGIKYRFSSEHNNCVVCNSQKIEIPQGYNTLHLLLASIDGDKRPTFKCNGCETTAYIPDCFEELGHWDLMRLSLTGYIKEKAQALTVSHTHSKTANLTAKQFHLFTAEIKLSGDNTVILPEDNNLILYAATATENNYSFISADDHFDKLKKRDFDYTFSDYANKRMKPAAPERFFDKLIDRKTSIKFKDGDFYNQFALNELYYIIRKFLDGITYKKKSEKLIENRKSRKQI